MEDKKIAARLLSAPYFRLNDSVGKLMLFQLAALAVPVIFSACFFGLRVIVLALSGVLGAVASEFLWQFAAGREITVGDLSAAVCGVLCACLLPASAPVWVPMAAAVFATVAVKLPFGPLGHSPFSPAAGGACFAVMLAAAGRATIPYRTSDEPLWQLLPGRLFDCPESTILPALRDVSAPETLDMLDRLSPLMLLRAGLDPALSPGELLLGGQKGVMCAALIPFIIAGAWLIITKTTAWQSCASYCACVAVLSLVFKYNGVSRIMSPVYELLCGCTLLIAFFIVGNTLTAPHTGTGRFIFGCLAGALTVLLRRIGAVEGAELFAALFVSALSSPIDDLIHYCRAHNISFTAARRSLAEAAHRRREQREESGSDAVTR